MNASRPRRCRLAKPPLRLTAAQQSLAARWRFLPRFAFHKLEHHELVRRLGVDDAESAGMVALCRAARNFDPSRKVLFKTYALCGIFREIYRAAECEGVIGVPANLLRSQQPHDAGRQQMARRAKNVLHLGDARHCEKAQIAELAAEETERLAPELIEHLDRLIRQLRPRDQTIIRLRYFEGCTLLEVSKAIGVTRERVRQLQIKAVEVLRAAFDFGKFNGV